MIGVFPRAVVRGLIALFLTAGAITPSMAHAFAFGISPPYVDANRLIPGAHFASGVYLVRDDASTDLVVTATLDAPLPAGSWVAVVPGSSFTIPQGQRQFFVPVRVDIPADADLGFYGGNLRFVACVPNPGGGVSICLGAHATVHIGVSLCGDSVVDPGEDCDDGEGLDLTGAASSGNWGTPDDDDCTVSCRLNVCGDGFVRSGVEACDDGNTNDRDTCGNDCAYNVCSGLLPGAPCTDDEQGCTIDECDGAGACTHLVAPSGTTCRAAVNVCDASEICDGVSPVCPTDVLLPAGVECRAVAGTCDVAESCNGVSDACAADSFVAVGTECRAAAGVCDLAESCTGTSAPCPADEKSTSLCRASAGGCDMAEICDGVSDTCPTDVLLPAGAECRGTADACDVAENCTGASVICPVDATQPDGTGCSDGAFCNGSESCLSGVCQIGIAPCILLCNEGADTCERGCPPAPQTCRTAALSILLVKDNGDDTRDRLIWKWNIGEATSQSEFGDPTNTTDYALCLYANSGSALVGEAIILASESKWSRIGTTGYKYGELMAADGGIAKVILKASTQNKSKVIVKAKGAALLDLSPPVGVDDPVDVQFVNGDTGLCWGASYNPDQLLKNEAGQLKAKTP